MKTLTMKYPGDPSCNVEIMSRQEFLIRFPNRKSQLWGPQGLIYETDMSNVICCDLCNQDPINYIVLVRNSRAYCKECAQTRVFPYCPGFQESDLELENA